MALFTAGRFLVVCFAGQGSDLSRAWLDDRPSGTVQRMTGLAIGVAHTLHVGGLVRMRLLIADELVLVRDALKTHVESLEPGAMVVTAGSVEEVLGLVDLQHRFDIAILDLLLPGMNRTDGLRAVRRQCPGMLVAVMSGNTHPQDISVVLAHGASGFIPKMLDGAALVGALRLMLSGKIFLPDSPHSPDSCSSPEHAKVPALTPRERQILDFLLTGSSNKEVARALDLGEVTVKMHVRGVLRKLGARNRTQAAVRAIALGLGG